MRLFARSDHAISDARNTHMFRISCPAPREAAKGNRFLEVRMKPKETGSANLKTDGSGEIVRNSMLHGRVY